MNQICKAGLHPWALMVLMACSVEAPLPEPRSGQSAVGLQSSCKLPGPFVPNFEPVLEWAWTGSQQFPQHRQVMMTPAVVDVNGDGTPDIVFNAFQGTNATSDGVLRAISGADGQDLWVADNPLARVRGTASVAAADIDQDGKVELCTLPETGTGIICFEHDGSLKFRTSVPSSAWGAISFADLEGDGEVEILHRGYVFRANGSLKWAGSDNTAALSSFAVDIDQDGIQEVVLGRTMYRHDGTIKCRNPQIGTGLAGVGDFDADPRGEIVIVWSGNVSLMDDDCSLLWTVPLPGGGTGGAPTIADLDHDGQPEIAVAGATRLVVFGADGSVKWEQPVQGGASGVSGSTAFDLEGDGQMELIHAAGSSLRIYDGATGAVRFTAPHSSATLYESPVIVDVDADGSAEIIVATNSASLMGPAGIQVLGDRVYGWVSTRRIWNQHAYAVVNVHDDGSIPERPGVPWSPPGSNTFRVNWQGPGIGRPVPAVDLVVSEVATECPSAADQLTLQAWVHNEGEAEAAAGLSVAFYAGAPHPALTLLGVGTLEQPVPPGEGTTVTLQVPPFSRGPVEIFAAIDDDGTGHGHQAECHENNNMASVTAAFSCNVPPVALCRDVTVAADPITCQATASVEGGSYDPDGLPSPLLTSESPAGAWGLGQHAVTLQVSDGESSRSCVGSVTVVDATPPTLTLVGEPVVEFECGGMLPPAVRAWDACHGDLTSQVEVQGLDAHRPGFHVVTHRVVDPSGNSAVGATRWVTVRDSFPPVLTLNGDGEVTLECGVDTWADPGATAMDECAGELEVHRYNSEQDPYGPGPNTAVEGTYSVQYIAWDTAGNTQSALRTVRVVDRTAPRLSLQGPPELIHPCGSGWVDPGVEAMDACYGDVTPSVQRIGYVNAWLEGTYTVRYEVSDRAGHSASPVTRTVHVVDCPW
jgi:hypothetical protein